LPTAAAAGLQASTAVGPVLFVPQVMSIQPLPALPVCGVQLGTGVVTVDGLQVIVVQLLPAFGACGVQLPTFTVLVLVLHKVSV